jgi:nucleotidyltransferase/DNA polymerase involved in DNA repair
VLALADASTSPSRLRSVSRAASRARVRVGMTIAEARAHYAGLEVRTWDDAVIGQAVVTTTAALLAASPQVTPVSGSPGMWWVGTTGNEPAFVHALMDIARTHHPDARVAIADSCVAAHAATWARRGGACIVPAGGCAAYLAPVPLTLIPMDEEVRAALHALGLRTAGALATLSAADVERRWGDLGLAAWRLAHGDDRRRPILARPEPRRVVTAELPVSTVTVDPVLFLLRAALDRLVTQLVADARTAATIALTLTLDGPADSPPHTITRQTHLTRPAARVAPLLEQCRALLERFTLSAPILGVTVAITATAPATGEQGDILTPTWRDPAAVEASLTRLRAELGPSSVVRPVTHDDHRPERTGIWTTGDAPDAPRHRPPASQPLPPAHRLLPAPEPVTVDHTNGRPTVLHWRARRISLDSATRPTHLSGAWWSDEYNRSYWHCPTSATGPEFLIFVDHTHDAQQWYVQGWRD